MTTSGSLPPPQTKEFGERILALEEDCRREQEQTAQAQQEIGLLLTKTLSEVDKLSTRELQASNRLRDMEMHLENYSREDIRDLYTGAHEVQLRLFMMRSQAEQLQSRLDHLKEFQEKLRLMTDLLALIPTDGSGGTQLLPAARNGGRAAYNGGTGPILGDEAGAGPSIMGLIEAQEDERLRISRQIHDGPTQTLSNLILRAEICERLIDRDVAEARSELSGLKAQINATLQETRRLIFDLRPMTLDDLGLVPTLRRYLSELGRGGLSGEVDGPEHDLRVSATMQVALFRFVQGVLAALLADGAAEHVDVRIAREPTAARITVEATGVETDRALVEERLQDPPLRHRLHLLDGHLTAVPRANRGLAIELVIPIPDDAVA